MELGLSKQTLDKKLNCTVAPIEYQENNSEVVYKSPENNSGNNNLHVKPYKDNQNQPNWIFTII